MPENGECKDFGTEKHAHCKDIKCRKRVRCIEAYLKKEGYL